MSDGREEREERERRIEQEKREDREDRVNHEDPDEWKPERVDSRVRRGRDSFEADFCNAIIHRGG